jgi:hypothetical protein
MQFIDDQIVGVIRARIVAPVVGRFVAGQHAERRAPVVRTRTHRRLATVVRRKEDLRRIRIENDLRRIEAVPLFRCARSIDTVRIVAPAWNGGSRNPAVPDMLGFVATRIEVMTIDRRHNVVAL